MRTIHKYQLELTSIQSIEMPIGASILSCDVQRDAVCIWALVDTDYEMCERHFEIFGTGDQMTGDEGIWPFVGTVQLGSRVWHIFERVEG